MRIDGARAGKIKELVLYGIFGVLTTGINILAYIFLTRFCGLWYVVSNAAAWAIGVLFAYYTNSRFVFGQIPFGAPLSRGQFIKFVGSRAATGVIDMALMVILVSGFGLDDRGAKVAVNILVILLNYVLSKIWIFRKVKE